MRIISKLAATLALSGALALTFAAGDAPPVEAASACAAPSAVVVRETEHSQMNPAVFTSGESCKDASAAFTIPASGKDARYANAIGATHEFKFETVLPNAQMKTVCSSNTLTFKVEYKSKKTKQWKTYSTKTTRGVWSANKCIARDHVFFQSGLKSTEDWGTEWRVSGKASRQGKPEGNIRLTAAPGVPMG